MDMERHPQGVKQQGLTGVNVEDTLDNSGRFLFLDKVSMLEGDDVDIGLLCFSLASFDHLLTVFRQDNQG